MSGGDGLLSAADSSALDSLEKKLHMVRDRVAGVVLGEQTGFYLHGTGGIGKSFTVLSHLDRLGASYKLFNSRMTAKGLFRALERAPDAIFVLEDMERLTKDADAQGVLRSALWSQPGHDRVVTWTTATGGEERFSFRGGLILLANRPLADLPELRAMATRITVARLEVTDAEMVALMRQLAADGYRREGKLAVEPADCLQIVEFVITECRATGCPLDLRLLTNSYRDYLQWATDNSDSYRDYLQWATDNSACHWADLVAARVREAARHFRHEADPATKEEKLAGRRRAAAEVLAETHDAAEQVKLYHERTGRSRADFFRRKKEIESGEFDAEAA